MISYTAILPERMAADIAEAYRLTILRFYELGCRDLQLDDTVIGRLLDPAVTREMEQEERTY